ncbi:MAG TPA: hypothetical protein VMR52_11610 [Dehalococcoidia bacterium]|nr:hypothetical protein [Dehalococcoidia bacterium]
MQIDLSDEELTLAREILQQEYMDLREEIYKTDSSQYKDQLREREALLAGLVKKLGD